MGAIRRIAILNHECDRRAGSIRYIAWCLADIWRAGGIEVEAVRGLDADVEADLLFPQIDLSVIPESYVAYFERFPRVINRRVTDIRKSTFAAHTLKPGDEWDGRVIVKTDRNYGGRPEQRLLGTISSKVSRRMRARFGPLVGHHDTTRPVDLGTTSVLEPSCYPVFDSLDDVPAEAFTNSALTVERFLPERCGEGYVLRTYSFLGDRWFTRRRVSPHPIVRGATSRLVDAPPLPPRLLAMREELGFDYGRFDFVIHDDEPVLLDVNATPTAAMDAYHGDLLRSLQDLAAGLRSLE